MSMTDEEAIEAGLRRAYRRGLYDGLNEAIMQADDLGFAGAEEVQFLELVRAEVARGKGLPLAYVEDMDKALERAVASWDEICRDLEGGA